MQDRRHRWTTFALVLSLIVAATGACGSRGARAPRSGAAVEGSADPAPRMSEPAEYADRPISIAAGENVFLETGGGDPYAAGLAYPIFLAFMEAYPEVLGEDWIAFAEKFGFIPDPTKTGDPKAPPIGFHLTTDPNTGVPWVVVNCQMCHTERIRLPSGDRIVPGLGSKRVRPHAYAHAITKIGVDPSLNEERITKLATKRAREWGVAWPQATRRGIVDATLHELRAASARRMPEVERLAVGLPGRVGTIESFAIALNDRYQAGIPMTKTIGWAKVPDVSSVPFRETLSYDGSGFGSPQALVLDADFVFGAREEWYLAHPHLATSLLLYMKHFSRKLPFPKPIDRELAARGKELFESNCSKCHGYYMSHDGEMRVSYKERIVPLDTVGTDPARANAVSPEFVKAANDVALTHGHALVRHTGGYVPPVLIDVWARGVFGHAGQWPSLEALATTPRERPRAFIVDPNGLYDLERVGDRYEAVELDGGKAFVRQDGKRVPRPLKKGEYVVDTSQPGLSAKGHPFLSDLAKPARAAVIAYLKTLTSH